MRGKMGSFVRALAVALAAVFCASHASAGFVGAFTVEGSGPSATVLNEEMTAATTAFEVSIVTGLPDLGFTAMEAAVVTDIATGGFTGTFELGGASGSLLGLLVGTVTPIEGGTIAAGSVIVLAGTGDFEGLSGVGSFGIVTDAAGISFWELGAVLVPGPGSLALLALGGIVTCRRRRAA